MSTVIDARQRFRVPQFSLNDRLVKARAEAGITREGRIVLAPGVFGHSGDPMTDTEKQRLDLLHLDKIDLAHQVFVVNPGGYIGESTRREINYARSAGKPVLYLVPESTGSER